MISHPTNRKADHDKDRSRKKITDKLISWASILKDNTEAQARTASSMPFVYPIWP